MCVHVCVSFCLCVYINMFFLIVVVVFSLGVHALTDALLEQPCQDNTANVVNTILVHLGLIKVRYMCTHGTCVHTHMHIHIHVHIHIHIHIIMYMHIHTYIPKKYQFQILLYIFVWCPFFVFVFYIFSTPLRCTALHAHVLGPRPTCTLE